MIKMNWTNQLRNNKEIIIAAALLAAAYYYLFIYQKSNENMELAEPNEILDLSPSVPGAGVLKTPKTANFNISEFKCKDGSNVPFVYYGNVQRLMNNLQVLRDHIGVPIHINSGYRSPSHNKKVGGASASSHLTAKAADITARGYTPAQLKATIEYLISIGKMEQGGIGLYKTFVHYDVRGSKARW